ncbi:MAG: single-stranded DNA-binding protein [Cyanobacteria bacterium P01_C01_bin.38]
MSINVVHLVGRVGIDPDMKYFDSGNVKCRLTLAVDRRRKDSGPDWFTLELWGKTAEIANSYVRKGKQIAVRGSLKLDSWNDRSTGVLRSLPVINVDDLQLLGSRRDSEAEMMNNDPGQF